MGKLQLRVKHRGGQSVVSSLTLQSKVEELQKELSIITDIPINRLKVMRGFPPCLIDLTDGSNLLCECGLQERDTLLVEEIPVSPNEVTTIDKPSSQNTNSPQTGILLKRVVPSDNSCLFTSIGFCLSGKYDGNCSSFMREIVASKIASHPEQYNEALLGKPVKDYCKWILQDDSWGGAIELAILSSYFGIEIDVVNTQHTVINKFGEDQNYGQRILLIYDGVHYDPLYLEPFDGTELQTLFPSGDGSVLQQAEELAAEARASHQYTDVYNFTLKCYDCNCLLQGQAKAQEHAKETGHTSFGEINPQS